MSAEDYADAFPDVPPEMVEQGLDMFAEGAVLVVFDFTDPDFASNLSVISIPGEAPLGLVEEQARTQIESLGGEVVDSGPVDIPTGKATRVEYTLDVAVPGGSSTPTSGVQYYGPFDGRTYLVTITAAEARPRWPSRSSPPSACSELAQGERRSFDRASHMSVLRWSDSTSMRSSSPWNIEP